MPEEFEQKLRDLINEHSKENESNTPDFILAMFMDGCLKAFNQATQQRETWYGRDATPMESTFPHDTVIETNLPSKA